MINSGSCRCLRHTAEPLSVTRKRQFLTMKAAIEVAKTNMSCRGIQNTWFAILPLIPAMEALKHHGPEGYAKQAPNAFG